MPAVSRAPRPGERRLTGHIRISEREDKHQMTFTYPAIFRQREDGSYEARFIDLDDCTATGDNLDLCIRDAIEAARSWIQVELEEEVPLLPPVTHIEDVVPEEGEIVRNIGVIVRMMDGYDE